MNQYAQVRDAFTRIDGPAIESRPEGARPHSSRPHGRQHLLRSSGLRAARSRPFRALAAAVTTAALAATAFAAAPAASAAVRPAHQVALQHLADHVTGYIDVLSSGRYEAVLAGPSGIKQASPVTFSTQAAASRYLARANDILKNASAAAQETAGSPAQESINGVGQESANSGYTTAKQHDWSIGLPCGFTCGADNSGGAHFWVIASYQQIANASLIAAFSAGCMAYLVPEIQGWAAPACGAAVYLLKTLAANEPRVPNHGVWAAIYFSHPWSPQGGRY